MEKKEMNKLGSAYLQAIAQQGDALLEMEQVIAQQDAANTSASIEKESRHQGISEAALSRKQIKKMSSTRMFSANELAEKKLIHGRMKNRKVLDTFRDLRTKLLAGSDDNNFVTMVTSVVPNSGSSLVASNLAAAFALDESKTALLVDANIHQPSLDGLFELEGKPGLIDYVEDTEIGLERAMHECGIPRLRVIPSGASRENTSEYFTSYRMRSLVEEITARYGDRYPIIDAPCIAESADSRILAELCNRVILVAAYGECTENQIKIAARAVGREKLAGIVLNRF